MSEARLRARAAGWCAALGLLAHSAAARASPPSEGRYAFHVYGKEDGLSDLDVERVIQDRDGFLWVATDGGLFRWGGRRFTRYGRDDGLPDDGVTTVHETRDGKLYAGTERGLARREGDRFVALGESHGLPESTIPYSGIADDGHGRVYVGTRRGLYASDDGDQFRLVPRADGRPETVAYGLHADPSGAVVFARGEGMLLRYDGTETTDLGARYGLQTSEWLDATATDRSGRLWVRTFRHLYVLSPGDDRFHEDDADLPAAYDSGRLALDDRGQLLVPTIRGVAHKDWATGRWAVLGLKEGLEAETTATALVDREGTLWVGLMGAGLARRLGRGAFTSWGRAQGLSYDRAASVVRDVHGALWVGTEEGLDRFDPRTGDTHVWHERDGLARDDARALAAASDGSVWAGAWTGGVTRIGPQSDRVRRYAFEGLDPSQVHVRAIHVARSGDVWVGTWDGLLRLAPGAERFARIEVPGAVEPDTLSAFAEDDSGVVFAATRTGILRVGPSPRRFGTASGLRTSNVLTMVRGPDGALFVGYMEPSVGVDRVEVQGDALVVTPISTTFAPRGIHALGIDASHRLWLTAVDGIDAVDLSGRPLAHYGTSDGLPADVVNYNFFVADEDGAVWLPSARGLLQYRPNVEAAPLPKPRVVITSCEASGKPLPLDAEAHVEHAERNLRFAWAGLTYVQPERVRFRWRLVGLDDAFTTTTLDEVRFPALPAGTYRFEVVATSAAGLDSDRSATFAFEVLPAWWETPWARGAGVLLALGLVAGAVRLRTRALEADRRRLEEAVAARSRELAKANRELAELSFTDALTNLRNRRYYVTIVGDQVERAASHWAATGMRGRPRNRDVVLYVVDIDHFKRVNDEHGHDAGDRVLAEFAKRLCAAARRTDLVVRWGGEEFVVLSTDSERTHADVLARRILASVGGAPFEIGGGVRLDLTCSIGWAPFPFFTDAPRAIAHDEVLALADRALYLAKHEGRARCVGLRARVAASRAAEVDVQWMRRPLEEESAVLELIRSEFPADDPVPASLPNPPRSS